MGYDRVASGAQSHTLPSTSSMVFVPSEETTRLVNDLKPPSTGSAPIEGQSSVKRPFADITVPVQPLVFKGSTPAAPSTPPRRVKPKPREVSPPKETRSVPMDNRLLDQNVSDTPKHPSQTKPLRDRIAARIASMP